MSEFDATGGRRSALDPIKPTGLGYRAVSSALMALAVALVLLALLMVGSSGPPAGLWLLWVAVWMLIVGVVLRIISDFLAALVDIARAVREGR